MENFPSRKQRVSSFIHLLLLLLVLGGAAYFRVVGLFWGEYQYLHPDERFLVWVGSDITPMKCAKPEVPVDACPPDERTWMGVNEYFDAANSTLNPNNRGHGFYVYGTLPMFITRYAVQWIFGQSGFMEMTQVGRALSALFDLFTVALVYLIAVRLYDRRVGLLAAAFSALAVLQIQQSHFFTTDTFVVFFLMLALYFAIRVQEAVSDQKSAISDQLSAVSYQLSAVSYQQSAISEQGAATTPQSPAPNPQHSDHNPRLTFSAVRFLSSPLFLLSILFGLALGMAVASKLNAAPMAVLLPLALAIGLLRLPPEQRGRRLGEVAGYLVLAGLVSFLVFRLAQPYAFSGPGFFGLKPNEQWVANIREQRIQSSGDVDMPPNMQWARRNILFSGLNLTVWGLGLPLGLLAWAGFLWMLWRMVTGEWKRHVLLWGWTAAYFAWQSLALNPTMRYQLPIYPTLAIIAGWALVALYDRGKRSEISDQRAFTGPQPPGAGRQPSITGRLLAVAAVIIGGTILLLTLGWAWAFSRIYTRPITRVEASRWMLSNIPGPITLEIETDDGGLAQQPLPFPYKLTVRPGSPFNTQFEARTPGTLTEVLLPHIADQGGTSEPRDLQVIISDRPGVDGVLATASVRVDPTGSGHPLGPAYTATLDRPVQLVENGLYYLTLMMPGDAQIVTGTCGPVTITLSTLTGPATQVIDAPVDCAIFPGQPHTSEFVVQGSGTLYQLFLSVPAGAENLPPSASYALTLLIPGDEEPLASAQINAGNLITDANLGRGYLFTLDTPVEVFAGEVYQLTVAIKGGSTAVTLSGAGIANESDWDDGLPLRMEGYDPYGGLYPQNLVFQMYWDDNLAKRSRFQEILDTSDYIAISSNRQWGSLPRLPERFPMTILYYRELLGCPLERSVEWCYSVSEPGMFAGRLGFELVKVFQSNPSFGPLEINDQFAEEAFTVYDHPKVLIFRKTEAYSPEQVSAMLESVDLSQVVRVLPMRAEPFPGNLMLPLDRLEGQREGGTWAELFNTDSLYNRYPFLGAILWYLVVAGLGLLAYPLVRLALPGLPDHGYPLARTAGLLLVAWLVWVAGSFKIPFERWTITAAIGLLAGLGGALAFLQRDGLRKELQQRGRYFLAIEGLFLAFFLFDLLIRVANPDLWHPFKGGEKPMDFAYFNAILKSTTFPPYDPWFAGGYLNYYYYGFVLVGTLVKWLGILPAIAYNLILPTLFSLIAMGAFSIGWNLMGVRGWGLGAGKIGDPDGPIVVGPILEPPTPYSQLPAVNPWLAGIAAALLMAVLGNLGTVRMVWQGYQRLGSPDGLIEEAGALTRLSWAASGFVRTLGGETLPFYPADWYWLPSRAIPAQGDIEPITEFPFFTVLYADPHAHLYALPVATLALATVLAVVLGRGQVRQRWRSPAGPWASALATLLLGGLAIGALRPTNTWDFYPYLALAAVALAYTLLSDLRPTSEGVRNIPVLNRIPADILRFLIALAGSGGTFVLVNKILQLAAPEGAASTNPLLPLVSLGIGGILALGAGIAIWTGLDDQRRTGYALSGLAALVAIALLAGLVFALYLPFGQWYGQAYNEIIQWTGPRTPLGSYLVHWGVFLFVLVSWMAWETHEWMDSTPLRAVRSLAPYRGLITGLAVALLALTAGLVLYRAPIALLALPLAAWAGVLLLRPNLPDSKRFVLFLVGTGLVMTLFVELFVLRGDIGRMNTVFKFYLQVWTLFAVSTAASLGWLLPELPRWLPGWRSAWTVVVGVLLAGAALFPLLGGVAKIQDRIAPEAPIGLDGMAYMSYAVFDETRPDGQVERLNLAEDYRGIRWMQENVQGSPVILEANSRNLYRWFNRYSIYTGLPGVVGWEWHQQQQRAITQSTNIAQRVTEVSEFYNTLDPEWGREFLQRYDVRYIILGPLERTVYAGPGLEKFAAQEGQLWRTVYNEGQTTIYEVIQ